MKKFLLTIMTFVSVITSVNAQYSDLSSLADAVYVQPANVAAGTQQTLSIRMKNSIEVQTIQFDLYLPDGFSVVLNEDDELITASKERINKFDYFQSSQQTDGAVRLLAQATSNNIVVGDGEIATIAVSVDASTVLGEYPVSVKNVLLVEKDNSSISVEEVITSVTVVDKENIRTVLDENSVTVPASDTNVNVLVKRTLNANEWSTICLPFNMTALQVKEIFGDDVQLGDFAGTDSEFDDDDNVTGISVKFEKTDAILANHPYIIKVSAPIAEFSIDHVDIQADEDEAYVEFDNGRTGSRRVVYSGFYGTYHAETVLDENVLYLEGNQFHYSSGQTTMKAYRAYFDFLDKISDTEGAVGSRIVISFNDDPTTRIDASLHEKGQSMQFGVYDLQGRKVNNSKAKGLYIENGKKKVKK